MNTPSSELNWSPFKSNAAHMNATLIKRQIFLLAQSGSLLEFYCRTGVHNHPQQTHNEGGRKKGKEPIVPEASGSLICNGNAVAEKKRTHLFLQLTVAWYCCENKRPRHDLTKPKVWVIRLNLLLDKLPRNIKHSPHRLDGCCIGAQRRSCDQYRAVGRKHRADKWCWRGTASLSGLIKRGDELPGLWREREMTAQLSLERLMSYNRSTFTRLKYHDKTDRRVPQLKEEEKRKQL